MPVARPPDADATPEGRTPSNGIKLSIVVPAYNEAQRIASGIERIRQAGENGAFQPSATEIIVVDDGSTDGTATQARDALEGAAHCHVLSLGANAGKGAAVRAGIRASSGTNVAFIDADAAVDPSQLLDLCTALRSADIAIGSRTLAESSAERELVRRSLMGRAFNRLVSMATDISLPDTQCGFKAFRTPIARLLFHFLVLERFAFDVDILSTANRLGLHVDEVPVHWRHIGGSRIRPLSDPLAMAIDVTTWRRRQRLAPSLSAIAVSHDEGGSRALETARGIAGPLLPLIDWRDESVLILLALCDATEGANLLKRLQAEGGTRARSLAVTVDQLSLGAALTLE